MRKTLTSAALVLLLSQLTLAQGAKSDSEENGLKGKVRSVNAQATRLSNQGGQDTGQTQLVYAESYDEQGNLTGRTTFDYRGNQRSEATYQIIDGEKTSKSKSYTYDYDPPPPMAPPPSGEPKPLDPRYDIKYKIKYDGNKIERTLFYGDGSTISRIVMTYDDNGNQIKREAYTPDGKLNYVRTAVFDDKGREVESASYSGNGSLLNKNKYTDYEVDWRGNWIKRKTWLARSEQADFEPIEVSMRTITYFGDQASAVGKTQPGSGPPKVIRVSTGVLAERAIKKVNPTYPPEAAAAKLSGEVLIEVTVDEEGNVAAAEGVSGDRILAEAAIAAVRQWKFKPMKMSGTPVKVIGSLRFNFNR